MLGDILEIQTKQGACLPMTHGEPEHLWSRQLCAVEGDQAQFPGCVRT